MKSHLQPRTTLAQRHAQPICASFFLERDLARPSRRRNASCKNAFTSECPSTPERADSNLVLANDQNRLRRIQFP